MVTNLRLDVPDALLKTVEQVRENYTEPPRPAQRGRPRTFSGQVFLLLAVVKRLLMKGAGVSRPDLRASFT
jgi:hypothetical protein